MSLEISRKKLELARVQVARQEQEFKILERQEEINRLQTAIEQQTAAEDKLKEAIAQLEKGTTNE